MLLQLLTRLNGRLQLHREEGQGMAEYALIIALIAVVIAAVLPGVGTAIMGVFNDIVAAL